MKRFVWIEKLTGYELFRWGLRALFFPTVVFYDENTMTDFARRVLRSAHGRCLRSVFSPTALVFGLKDERGDAINYACTRNVSECLEYFSKVEIPRESTRRREMLKQYIITHIFSRFIYVTMVEYSPDFKRIAPGARAVIRLARHPLNYLIRKQYRQYTFSEAPISMESIRYFMLPFSNLTTLVASFFFRGSSTRPVSSKPSVFIEYSPGSSIDFAFWRNYTDRSIYDLYYYTDRNNDPAPQFIERDVAGKKAYWVDLHFKNFARIARLTVGDITELFFLLPWIPSWRMVAAFQYRMWYLLYRAVFRAYRTKIIIQHLEFSWIQEVQVQAVQAAGGIMIGFHWSHHYLTDQPIFFPMHILFVWGKKSYDYYQKKGTTCEYILPSGLWVVPEKGRMTPGNVARDSFTVAILDNNVYYNTNFDVSTLSVFYGSLVDLFERNPRWRGVIKSREFRMSDIHPIYEGLPFWDGLKKLIDEGRVQVLSTSLLPSEAAERADLTVCYGISSAGIIAAITGAYAVHWDPCGYSRYPMYRYSDQRVFYRDIDAFSDAIESFSRGDTRIGDFSKFRRAFNFFDDLRAKQRVGAFIESFLRESDGTQEASEALRICVREYIEKNHVTDEYFSSNNWWDDVVSNGESTVLGAKLPKEL